MDKELTNPNDYAFANEWHGGLNKREYFAAMALQGLCTSCEQMEADKVNKLMKHWKETHGDVTIAEALVKDAVKISDALIAELNKTPQP